MPERVTRKSAPQAARLDAARLLAVAEAAMTAAVQVGEPGDRAAILPPTADRILGRARRLRQLRHNLEREAGEAAVRGAWEEGWAEGRAAADRLTGRGGSRQS